MKDLIRDLWFSPLDGLILNGSNCSWDYTQEQWKELERIGKALAQLARSELLPTELENGQEFFERMTGKPVNPEFYKAWAGKVDAQAEIVRLREVIKFRNRQIRDLRRSLRK